MTYKIVRSVEFALCRHTLQQTILFKNSKNHDEIPRDSIYKKNLETKHYETFSVQICRNSTFHYFISRLGINASKLFVVIVKFPPFRRIGTLWCEFLHTQAQYANQCMHSNLTNTVPYFSAKSLKVLLP